MSATQAAPLVFTLDLTAPCSGSACTGTNPTDIGLQLQANAFNYAVGTGSQAGNFLTQIGLQTPLVCDEIQSNGTSGPATTSRFEPDFTNASPGGLLEFNAGGASIVDMAAFSYDGAVPAGVAASYGNYNAPQVICYQVNSVAGGTPVFAAGPGGIFSNGFENHVAGEPWISVQTVYSPNATAPAAPTAPNAPTPANTMAYVVQIHNASNAVNWRLTLGYDDKFFTGASQWGCVLGSNNPQPGPISGTCGSTISLPYTLKAADVQSATNSIYIYVNNTGSSAASTNWSTLGTGFYPAAAAVFPLFGTYPRRMDDKSAVATASNVPVQNIGSIVCNNDQTSTSCQVAGQETGSGGTALLPSFNPYTNTVSGSGSVTEDPLVYFVDPTSGSTMPGNLTADALTASNVSCSDPAGILASAITASSFTASPSAKGGLALNFAFAKSGSNYVPGTATCTATFTNTGYSPNLSSTYSFSITMLQTVATHFSVSAPPSVTAGGAFNFTVNALDSSNNVVPSYNGTVNFASSDTSNQKSLPANSKLTNGSSTFSATLVTAGNQTITATDTVSTSITGVTSPAITVGPGAATQYQLNVPSSATHAVQTSFLITAQDTYGNTATGYTGTVHFTSSDASAIFSPLSTTLTGTTSIGVTFATTGPQTITATDTANSLTKTSSSITVN